MDEFVLDMDRERRLGFPEVIFGARKPTELLRTIFGEYQTAGLNALATRVQPEKAESLINDFPGARYDSVSQSFILKENQLDEEKAKIAIISAGSSDTFVVNEAYYAFNLLEEPVVRVNDIGVAGIHRLMDRLDILRKFKVLIVVAGFEGALPSVVGGLLSQPIIAVPTSTGYGVGAGGQTALHAMLSSCANGITVVNIDNGYGAAMAAYRILMQFESNG